MLEQHERGEEPDFDGFMERHGEFFPGNPQNLDELLEQMAQSMAQMQQLMNSMTPEQRAQLQALSESLLEDMDLRWQVDQLVPEPAAGVPQPAVAALAELQRQRPAAVRRDAGAARHLGDLDALENLMKSATQPGELAEVDLDRARELLGDDAARSLDRLRELQRMLEEAGLIEQREGRLELTPRAIRAIGNKALSDLYRKLVKDRAGRHELERTGFGNEHAHDHKPYEFGDPFHLNVQETVKNAIWRVGRGHAGAAEAGRLRGGAHRDAHALGHRAAARRVAVDADARQLPAGQEGGDGAARAHHQPVPTRLLRPGVVRARRA